MKTGIKHLVRCNCILPQFKKVSPPVFHEFCVFSVVEDNGSVVTKFVQCPNCDTVHKIDNLTRSSILSGKEHISSRLTVNDLRESINPKIAALLDANDADVATWENVLFLIENEQWGGTVVLSTDKYGFEKQAKVLIVLSKSIVKIEQHTVQEYVDLP